MSGEKARGKKVDTLTHQAYRSSPHKAETCSDGHRIHSTRCLSMLSNERTLALLGTLATASVTGIGLALGGAIGATVMAGVGINLGSTIIQNGSVKLKERWLHDGVLNHDIQKALVRAFIKSLSALEGKFLASERAAGLRSFERASIRSLFRELRDKAQTDLQGTLLSVRLEGEVRHYLLGVPETDMGEVWDAMGLDELVVTYGSEFGDFIREHLLSELIFWFNEELKTDDTDNNKAWRAFQRMLLEGIYADVKAVQGGQEEVRRDLLKLDLLNVQLSEVRDVIDRRLPDELFQHDLEDAVGEIRSTIQRIDDTTQRIDRNVIRLLGDQKERLPEDKLRGRLSQIRQKMISADDTWKLREALYEVEELLPKYPNAEARQLKHQIELALLREAPRAMYPDDMLVARGPAQMIPQMAPYKSHRPIMKGCLILITITVVAAALYLLVRWIF